MGSSSDSGWDEAGLLRMADRQGGCFTTKQAAEHGISRAVLWKRVRSGNLVNPDTAIYRIRSSDESPGSDIFTALLTMGWPEIEAAICGRTALWLWGIAARGPTIEVLVPYTCKRSGRGKITVHHGSVFATHWHQGIPVTSPARSLVDLLHWGPDRALAAEYVARALRSGAATEEELLAEARRRNAWIREAMTGAIAGRGHPRGSCAICGKLSQRVRCTQCLSRHRLPLIVRRLRRLQANTSPVAQRRGQPWSAEEDVAVLSDQETMADLARALGRSFYAVNSRRHVLRMRAKVPTGSLHEASGPCS